MSKKLIHKKWFVLFLFIPSILFALFFFHIRNNLSCDVPDENPMTYDEAFERAGNYYARAELGGVFALYLWRSPTVTQCYQLALENFDRALLMEPNHADALLNRASTYYSLEQYQNAINDYKKVLEIAPQNQHVRLEMARTYEESGQLEASVQAYEEAVAFMEDSAYWINFYPDDIVEYQTKLKNLQRDLQQQPSN